MGGVRRRRRRCWNRPAFLLERATGGAPTVAAKCWNQQPRPPAGFFFCVNQPLFLLEPLSIFAGTSDFPWMRVQKYFFFFAGIAIFGAAGDQVCFNQPSFLLEASGFFATTLFCFVFCSNQHKNCYHRLSILLEPAFFSASIK